MPRRTTPGRGVRFSAVACGGAALLILTGCSSLQNGTDPYKSAGSEKKVKEELGYQPKVRKVGHSEEEVNKISHAVLSWMDAEGKTTEFGASGGTCDAVDPNFEKYYSVRHPWSIIRLESGTFKNAMENLRQQLPKHGWHITKDGKTNSPARNPEIIAVQPKSHHTMVIEWTKNRAEKKGKTESIIVRVNSRCYRAPQGTDLSEESS